MMKLRVGAAILVVVMCGCGIQPIAKLLPTALDANGHTVNVVAAKGPSFTYKRLLNGLQFQLGSTTKTLIFYGPQTVRVNSHLGSNHWHHPSIVVTDKPDSVPFRIDESTAELTLVAERLRIRVDKTTGALIFSDADGRVYTEESREQPQTIKPVEIAGAPTYEVQNRFHLKPDEAIYGFGFVNEGKLNRRGQNILLVQTNVGIVIPVMVSSERYGILWDTHSVMRFSDSDEGASLWAESAPGGVDYYFMAGKSVDDVVGAYRGLTGDAPMYPKQAFGLFMSKERYPSQARLLEVAKTFRDEGFPLDYIVQDWQYWGSDTDGSWSGMIWDQERFPQPQAMTDTLHNMHLKLMVSIWPSVGNDTALAKELDQQGLRFEPLHWISKKARIYDAFSEQGRAIYFKHIKSGLLDKGVDALWMDGTEVEVGTACWDPYEVARDIKALGNNAMGDFSRYLNAYSLMTTAGTYQGQRATDNKRVFTLTRSGWAGAQRTGAASWSGDIFGTWKTLREQISGGLSVTITGNPYWTQDIGGFFVTDFPGGEQNPEYRELFARWFQFGVFNPIMRVHGTSIEREPYIFKSLDPQVYRSLLASVNLRYRLLPYIYSQSWQVTNERSTLMRPLMMDFPDDQRARNIDDAFMFGPAFLVHPVTRPMYRVPKPEPVTIDQQYLRTPDDQPGLAGQYFEGIEFNSAKGRVIDLVLDHDWPGPPLAEMPAGLTSTANFSARWQGTLIAPESGEYEIGIEGDDGFRLILNGETLVEEWSQSAPRYRGTKTLLTAGERLPIVVEFFQAGGGRKLRLSWRTPSDIAAIAKAKPQTDNSVTTWLPQGSDWYDFNSGKRFSGGREIIQNTPLDRIPLYVRAGSIVPMGPEMQYATEKPAAPYDVLIYTGADGKFTIYEDDNETYNYEQGEYATFDLVWNDTTRILHIGQRQGHYPALVQNRILNVRVIGGEEKSEKIKQVLYTGQAQALQF